MRFGRGLPSRLEGTHETVPGGRLLLLILLPSTARGKADSLTIQWVEIGNMGTVRVCLERNQASRGRPEKDTHGAESS